MIQWGGQACINGKPAPVPSCRGLTDRRALYAISGACYVPIDLDSGMRPAHLMILLAKSHILVSAELGGEVKRSRGFWGCAPPPLVPEARG